MLVKSLRFLIFGTLITLICYQAAAGQAAITPQTATAAPYRATELEGRLPTPVEVYSTENTYVSYAHIGQGRIYLARWVAPLLARGPGATDEQMQASWATAAFTLYHEWWHLAFSEFNEQNTDLGAITMFRYMLRHYWGLSAAEAQNQYMQIAGPNGALMTYYHPAYARDAADPLQ